MIKYLALCSLLLFSACFAQKKVSVNYFEYGRTRQDVVDHIQGRNELIIGEFNLPEGHMAVYQYGRVGQMEARQDRYYLYFLNDTLVRKSSPEPLESNAKRAINDYYRNKQIKEEDRKEREAYEKEQQVRHREKEAYQKEKMRGRQSRSSESKTRDHKRGWHTRRKTKKEAAQDDDDANKQ